MLAETDQFYTYANQSGVYAHIFYVLGYIINSLLRFFPSFQEITLRAIPYMFISRQARRPGIVKFHPHFFSHRHTVTDLNFD